jgi:hypothetical protein
MNVGFMYKIVYSESMCLSIQNEDSCIICICLYNYQHLVESRTAADTKDSVAVLVRNCCR